MLLYQERVVAEKSSLDEKIAKLEAFIDAEVFTAISQDEQELLNRQHAIMCDYSSVLGERIASFTQQEPTTEL